VSKPRSNLNIPRLLAMLSVPRERLEGRAQIAIPGRILHAILKELASLLPFDEEFYITNYHDLSKMREADALPDPHGHFVMVGFFQGRVGARPSVDEDFYLRMYPDVAQAIARGALESGIQHYILSGSMEGRLPDNETANVEKSWLIDDSDLEGETEL
jgi:hypothetical protein